MAQRILQDMNRRFTVRLYPNQAQQRAFETWENHSRFIWNIALEQRLDAWKKRKFPTKFDQSKQLTELKQECEWLYETPAITLKEVLGALDDAMKRCWKKKAKRPRFKSKERGDNVQMYVSMGNKHIDKTHVTLPHVGKVHYRGLKDAMPGELRSLNLKREGDKWYASLLFRCPDVPATRHEHAGRVVGIDRGVTDIVADSNGVTHVNPRFYEKALDRLKTAQRVFSRRKKGSKRRRKARLVVSGLHHRVCNQRKDYLHKLSTDYAAQNGVVVIEKLETSKMVHGNRGLNRSIHGAGWSMFANMLKYKLEERGGKLVEVNPAYTSQTCSKCSHVAKDSRAGKHFECVSCGHSEDADLNAAKNIRARYAEPKV